MDKSRKIKIVQLILIPIGLALIIYIYSRFFVFDTVAKLETILGITIGIIALLVINIVNKYYGKKKNRRNT